MTGPFADLLAIAALVAVLATAILRPRRLPEVAVAIPAAGLLIALGVIGPDHALDQVAAMGPTLLFLSAILLLGHLADRAGVFAWAGAVMARGVEGSPQLLLNRVVLIAAATTVTLSLDATVVLLTPVVLLTARALRMPARPHSYATVHLSNSASVLLPVSNLTNLLAWQASGLGFGVFAVLMLVPWLLVLTTELVALRLVFRRDLQPLSVQQATGPQEAASAQLGRAVPVTPPAPADAVPDEVVADAWTSGLPAPRFALAVLASTLLGFAAAAPLGLEPWMMAVAGAAVLLVQQLLGAEAPLRRLLGAGRALNLPFLGFVAGLAIVVAAVTQGAVGEQIRALAPTGQGLGALLLLALLAAVLANLVNNLPATLILVPLAVAGGPLAVLAVLLGVNIGPNLTYVGSLATLLWRRVHPGDGPRADLRDFTVLGLVTVPVQLLLGTCALWGVGTLLGF